MLSGLDDVLVSVGAVRTTTLLMNTLCVKNALLNWWMIHLSGVDWFSFRTVLVDSSSSELLKNSLRLRLVLRSQRWCLSASFRETWKPLTDLWDFFCCFCFSFVLFFLLQILSRRPRVVSLLCCFCSSSKVGRGHVAADLRGSRLQWDHHPHPG